MLTLQNTGRKDTKTLWFTKQPEDILLYVKLNEDIKLHLSLSIIFFLLLTSQKNPGCYKTGMYYNLKLWMFYFKKLSIRSKASFELITAMGKPAPGIVEAPT